VPPVPARGSQSCECGSEPLDFLLCSYEFFLQLPCHSKLVSHWFSLSNGLQSMGGACPMTGVT
jgi:hypothetical protein